jgi:hypothetical protein
MFNIEAENWFSLFKRGVELLADMSTFRFSATAPETTWRQQLPQPLQTGNIKGKLPHSRQILVKKAKATTFQRQKTGMASLNKWAWRPTDYGHCVPQKMGMASLNKWALRPTETGHCVPESILFGGHMLKAFFPHRFNTQLGSQAIAAAEWFAAATCWQHLP